MTVLVLAPHADDEVLGLGGTIAKLTASGVDVQVAIITNGGPGKHPFIDAKEFSTVRDECEKSCALLGVSRVTFAGLPAACLDHHPVWKTNKQIHEIVEEAEPSELYLPFPDDLHKDHAAVAYGGAVSSRPYLPLGRKLQRVLYYETLTETHLAPPYLAAAFQPNLFVDISDFLDKKVEAFEMYKSQLQPGCLPRNGRGLRTLAQYRGMHIGVEAAEAFVIARMVA